MQTPLFDLYRAGVRSATDLMKASLDNTERLQQQQLEMVGGQLERATELWTGLWRAAGEAQKAMIDSMQAQLEASQDAQDDAYAAVERGTGDAAELAASQVAAAVGQARRRAG